MDKPGAVKTDGDAAGHVGLVREFYRNEGKPIDLSDRYLLEYTDYPTGFHKLIFFSRLDPDKLFEKGRFIPLYADVCLFIVIAYAIAKFGGENFAWLLFFPFMRMLYGNQGRSSHFNERAYGVLLANIYLLAGYAVFANATPLGLVVAIIAYTALAVSSKFAIQAVFLYSLALTFVFWTPVFILLLIVSLFLSVIFSKGYTVRVLQGLVRQSLWYARMQCSGKIKSEMHWGQLTKVSFSFSYALLLFRNSVLRVVTDSPLNIVVAGIAFSTSAHRVWAFWALSGVVICLIVATRRLEFIGEPERYLEFAVIPSFVYLSFLPVKDVPYLAAVATVVTLAILLPSIWLRLQGHKGLFQRGEALEDVALWLKSQGPVTVFTNPGRISIFLGLYAPSASFVWLFTNVGKGVRMNDFEELLDSYPRLSNHAFTIARKIGAQLLVYEKFTGRKPEEVSSLLLMGLGHCEYENDFFEVYRVV